MENKKTKLTISGSPKKTLKNFETSKSLGKKTVKINDQKIKSSKSNFNKPFLKNICSSTQHENCSNCFFSYC